MSPDIEWATLLKRVIDGRSSTAHDLSRAAVERDFYSM